MNKLAKIIGTGALLLTLSSGLVSAIEPQTEIAKEIKRLLSIPNCHECVLKAIKRSKYIERISKIYYPKDDIQQAIYETSMLLVESGNPANALRVSYEVKDFEKRYEIAEALVRSGNPLNGVRCFQSMYRPHILRGIKLLEETGNPENAKILKSFLGEIFPDKPLREYLQ